MAAQLFHIPEAATDCSQLLYVHIVNIVKVLVFNSKLNLNYCDPSDRNYMSNLGTVAICSRNLVGAVFGAACARRHVIVILTRTIMANRLASTTFSLRPTA